jgi:hypothetical protein
MTHRIEVNVQTGEQQIVNLTAEEIAVAQAQKAKWEAEQTVVAQTPTVAELLARIEALENK